MDVSSIVNIALPIVFVIVGLALIWFLIELVRTVKSARGLVNDVQERITPTLDHVEKITNDLQPAVAKVDPLVERVSLTVDAANLELMRVDQILEDVNQVTDSVSNASAAIDTVTAAPADLVNAVSSKVRGMLKGGHHASPESAELAAKKAEVRETLAAAKGDTAQEAPAAKPVGEIIDRIAEAAAAQTNVDVDSAETQERKYYTYGAADKPATTSEEAPADDAGTSEKDADGTASHTD